MTGLYYYGARYYDPRTSVWQSPDPILEQYMGGKPNGGVFNPKNLMMFSYTTNNPINLVDPDGNAGTHFILTIELDSKAQYGSKSFHFSTEGVFSSSISKSRADSNGANAAAKSGIYKMKATLYGGGNKTFAKHTAFLVNNGKAVPTEGPNKNQKGKSIMTEMFEHVGNRAFKGKTSTGSEGCLTIPAVIGGADYSPKKTSTWTNYNKFMKGVDKGDTAYLGVIRLGGVVKEGKKIVESIKNIFNNGK